MPRLINSSLATALFAGVAVAAGFFGGGAMLDKLQFARAETQVESARQQLGQVEDLSSIFRDVAKVVEPSVVKIEVTKTVHVPRGGPDNGMLRRFFRDNGQDTPDQGEQDFQQDGTGSGVIMETSGGYGFILTNNHVAGDASDIRITLSDGRVIEHGRLLGADPKSDLAVVRIKSDDLIAARWGNSDDLQKGDWILAFGSPLGYAGSMTHGIVSALNRRDVGIITHGYEDFIQVDAPINPGNSGGPLVNLHGEVVGINTAIASNTGFFNGIGFAIPSNQAHSVYTTLKATGKVVRGWLGVGISSVSDDPRIAKSFGYDKTTGVLIDDPIPNTPAYGKLNGGDIVTAINGQPVSDTDQLRGIVAGTAPGTPITLKVFRDGKNQDISITVASLPTDDQIAAATTSTPHHARPTTDQPAEQRPLDVNQYGLQLENLNDNLAQRIGVDPGTTGAVISRVRNNSVGDTSGLRPGLVITHVGKTEVNTAREAYNALKATNPKEGIRLTILRPDGSTFQYVQQEDDAPSDN